LSHEAIVLNQTVQVSVPRDRAVKVKSPELTPVVSEEGAKRVYRWTRSNLVRQATPKSEITDQVAHGTRPNPDIQLSSFENWEQMGRWYDELQRARVMPTFEIREKAAELTRNAPDDAAKIRAIYKYVSTEFRYMGVAFGIGRYQPHAAAEVLANQYGDCKDKHTLLASLLAAAGIPAYPALINSAFAVDADVPSPKQFDHVITAVPRGKEILWLDATPAVAPLGYLQTSLRDKKALVVFSEKPAAFQTTPTDLPFPMSWVFKIDAKLDESGTLEGQVEQTMRGDLEFLMRTSLHNTPRAQWKDVIQQLSYGTGFAGEVSDVNASLPESTETPLHITYTYKRKDYPDWKNHRIRPPTPAIFSMPPEEDGKLPAHLWIGALGRLQFEARIELPQGYAPDPTEQADFQEKFATYHAEYAREGNALVAKYRVETKERELSGTAVNDYKAFADKVHEERDRYIPLLSGRQERTGQTALLNFQEQILKLPDSGDPKARQAESDARTAAQKSSMQDAIDGFKEAVADDPKFTRDWLFLGQLYMASGQKDAGIDAFRRGVSSDPQRPVSYKVLAFALMSLGRRSEAIGVWQELAKVSPDDRDIPPNMGTLLVAEQRYREAVPYLEAAAKTYPDNARSLALLGTAYLQDGDDEKALGIFAKMIELNPGASTKNTIGYVLANSNKHLDDALRYAQEAVHEQEEDSRKVQLSALKVEDLRHTINLGAYWDTLGWVHYRLGNLKAAEGYLHAAWTVLQGSVIGYHLGQVYEAEQRKQDAAHMYRVVASMTPRGAEDAESTEAAADAQRRLEILGVPVTPSDTQKRLESRKIPIPPDLKGRLGSISTGEELSQEREILLPKLVSGEAVAEFFILLGPGAKVEDTKFISGSDKLKSAGKALVEAHFKISFPEQSTAHLVRRGILVCNPGSGCSFVLIPPESVVRVD
jgi:tetratricopeptide (TPR) repeat protein